MKVWNIRHAFFSLATIPINFPPFYTKSMVRISINNWLLPHACCLTIPMNQLVMSTNQLNSAQKQRHLLTLYKTCRCLPTRTASSHGSYDSYRKRPPQPYLIHKWFKFLIYAQYGPYNQKLMCMQRNWRGHWYPLSTVYHHPCLVFQIPPNPQYPSL